jgi:VIT1/CCC1 family predicted Fe2+/Mn2+ transporter
MVCNHCGHRELTALPREGDGSAGPSSPRPPEIHERAAHEELEGERAERDQLQIQIEPPRRRAHEAERLLDERRAFEDEVVSSRSASGEPERSLEERSAELDETRRRRRAKRGEMQAQWDHERHDPLNDTERLLGEVRERLKVELQGWHDRLTTARRQFDRDLENLRGEVDRISCDAEDSLQEEATVLEPAEVISHEHEPSAPRLEAPPVSSRSEEPSHPVEVKRSARVTAKGQRDGGRAPSWRESPEDFERFDALRSAPRRRIPFILMLLGGLTVAILCLMPYLFLPMQWSTYAVSTTLGLLGVMIFSFIEARLIGANPLRYALQAALVGGVNVALFLLVSRLILHSI